MLSRTSEKLRKRENWLDLPKIRSLRSSLRIQSGFTIIELLVTISIVALLMSLMMPGFKAVRESANRIQCSSNLRQLGLAIFSYSTQNGDYLPKTIFDDDQTSMPRELMALTTGDNFLSLNIENQWDGLGLLVCNGNMFLDSPNVLYCPCHCGSHPSSDFDTAKKLTGARVFGNYHYIGDTNREKQCKRRPADQSSENPLVADGMREKSDVNHRNGANILYGDLSVRFWHDRNLLLRNFMLSISDSQPPAQIEDTYKNLWKQFERSN